jgi:hypothetical protein
VNHNTFFAAFTLFELILASGSLSSVLAQGKAQEEVQLTLKPILPQGCDYISGDVLS